MDIYFNQP